uniref:LIM zinc-binding domain-containing protein n=1 Tax=Panagrellus redivivus TaxID=6233 RepID=A0A7E4VWH1_PANRE
MYQNRCRSALDTIEERDYEKVVLAHRRRASSSSESASVHTASSRGSERNKGTDVVWSTPAEGLRYTAVLGSDAGKREFEEQERRLFLAEEERRNGRTAETTFASGRMGAERLANNNYTSRHPPTPSELGSSFYDTSTQRATTETRRTVRMEREEREFGRENNHLSSHQLTGQSYPEQNARTVPIRRVEATAPPPVFENVDSTTLRRSHYDLAEAPPPTDFETTESTTILRRGRYDRTEPPSPPQNCAHKCNSCEVLLNDMLTYIREGKYYCQRHYETQSRSLNVGGSDYGGFERTRQRDSRKMTTPPRCAGCDELIFDRDLLMANGTFWHRDHFRCGICGDAIGTGLYRIVKKEHCCCRCSSGSRKRVVRVENTTSNGCNHRHCREDDTKYVLCSRANRVRNYQTSVCYA